MCYAMPTAGAIVTTVLWNKTKNIKILWLNLLFWGGAIFGLVDHWWNRELFLISENIVSDLILGVVITLSIIGVWAVMLAVSKKAKVLQYGKT